MHDSDVSEGRITLELQELVDLQRWMLQKIQSTASARADVQLLSRLAEDSAGDENWSHVAHNLSKW